MPSSTPCWRLEHWLEEIAPLLPPVRPLEQSRDIDADSGDDADVSNSSTMSAAAAAANAGDDDGVKPGIDEAILAQAIRLEHDMTFAEAVRLYPVAIGWSAFVSIGVIMLAFDPQLLGNFFAMPQFARDFGFKFGDDYIISAAWQTGLSVGNPVGQVVGALFAAYPMDWWGRKRTFAACVVLTGCLVFIQFSARSLRVLLVGELLGGLVLGMYVVIAPAYASEVCPTVLRGHLTAYVNLCFVMGQLLANGVTAGTQKLQNHWAYSLPFALQWVWVAIILPGLLFVPESPWWLVRKGRIEDARKILMVLASNDVNIEASLAFIVKTDRLEQEFEDGGTYQDCFKGVNLRRTEISTGVYCSQVLSGIYLINYGTYFFRQAGLATDKAFDMAIGFLAVGFIGTVLSWFLLIHFGRRIIYNMGLFILVILQVIIAILDCVPGRPASAIWAESSLMLVWNLVYNLSIGPVCFVLISECSSTRLRSKTIAVATAAQGVLGIVMTIAIPYMINPDKANMQGKLGFFFGGLAGLCFVWAYFRVPETMGRTYEELDLLFGRRVPAREFNSYDVNEAVSSVP